MDTDNWITLWNKYPPTVPALAGIWTRLAAMIASVDLVSPDAVYDELERGGDGLLVWLEDKKACFQPLDEMVQAAVREVLAKYPDFADDDATETSADPFVVGLAIARSGIVVSNEKPKRPGGITKIPDACAGFGVRCITLLGFLGEVT